jgi:hypothetical protein
MGFDSLSRRNGYFHYAGNFYEHVVSALHGGIIIHAYIPQTPTTIQKSKSALHLELKPMCNALLSDPLTNNF